MFETGLAVLGERRVSTRVARVFTVAGFLLVLLTAPALAQTFDQELPPAEKLTLDLANADLWVSWRSGPTSHAKARPARPPEAEEEPAAVNPGPALEVRQKGTKVEVWRAPEAGEGRLQVEIVVGGAKSLHIQGSGLNLTVTAPIESGRRIAAAQTFLVLEGSDADLTMLVAGSVQANDSRIVSRQSEEDLRVTLVGGGGEIESHQGKLLLQGERSEFLVRGVEGEIRVDLKSGRCELLQSQGKLEVMVSQGAALLLNEWSGEANLAANEAHLDLRNFWPEPQVLRVKSTASAMVIDGLETAQIDLELQGGTLEMNDTRAVEGRVGSQGGAKVEIRRSVGSWTGIFQDSDVIIESADRPNLEIHQGQIEIEGIEELNLVARESTINANTVGYINSLNMTGSEGEFSLLEGGRAEVMVQGASTAIFNLMTPCYVAIPLPTEESEEPSWLEVSGCVQEEKLAEDGASVLSGSVLGGSRVEVRSAY